MMRSNQVPDLMLKAFTNTGVFNLNQPNKGLLLTNHTGLFGLSNITRLRTSGPGQIGETDRGYDVATRIVTLEWAVYNYGRKSHPLKERDDVRQMLLQVFRPTSDDPVQLWFYTQSGIRAVDVFLEGSMTYDQGSDIGYAAHTMNAALRAADPRLYDPRQKTATFQLSSTIVNGWEVPWPIAWNIGESTFDGTLTISYANLDQLADIEYPSIRINGPIDDPVITNESTGETISFTAEGGLSLLVGEYVIIDLSYDSKTAIDDTGTSVEQYIEPDSDLTTFHLSYNGERLADGSISNGVNTIKVIGGSVTDQSSVVFTYYDRYAGA
jgi:hypothetical protein